MRDPAKNSVRATLFVVFILAICFTPFPVWAGVETTLALSPNQISAFNLVITDSGVFAATCAAYHIKPRPSMGVGIHVPRGEPGSMRSTLFGNNKMNYFTKSYGEITAPRGEPESQKASCEAEKVNTLNHTPCPTCGGAMVRA